jgi:hypothetical protein
MSRALGFNFCFHFNLIIAIDEMFKNFREFFSCSTVHAVKYLSDKKAPKTVKYCFFQLLKAFVHWSRVGGRKNFWGRPRLLPAANWERAGAPALARGHQFKYEGARPGATETIETKNIFSRNLLLFCARYKTLSLLYRQNRMSSIIRDWFWSSILFKPKF